MFVISYRYDGDLVGNVVELISDQQDLYEDELQNNSGYFLYEGHLPDEPPYKMGKRYVLMVNLDDKTFYYAEVDGSLSDHEKVIIMQEQQDAIVLELLQLKGLI